MKGHGGLYLELDLHRTVSDGKVCRILSSENVFKSKKANFKNITIAPLLYSITQVIEN